MKVLSFVRDVWNFEMTPKKVKFNLSSEIELSEMAAFVYNFV